MEGDMLRKEKNRNTGCIRLMSYALVAALLFLPNPADAVQVIPGEGLEFAQVDLTFPGATQFDSPYGLAIVEPSLLLASTGAGGGGYLNIHTTQGWVVRNVPVDATMGYAGITTLFDLGTSSDVLLLDAHAELTSSPLTSFTGSTPLTFPVGTAQNNAQGMGSPRTDPPSNSVDASVLSFTALGVIEAHWQPGHPNIDVDTNQCGPAAAANSLAWHQANGVIPVKHVHRPGIGDGSLVGELDKDMGRMPQMPINDDDLIRGVLRYLDTNNLDQTLSVKHKVRPGQTWNIAAADITEAGVTSMHVGAGDIVDWIIDEVRKGENVEVLISWDGGGGHWIDLVGAGRVLGVPWIAWVHDADQGHVALPGGGTAVDQANGGTAPAEGGLGFSFVDGHRLTAYIEGKTNPATIDVAVAESPIPPTVGGFMLDATDLRASPAGPAMVVVLALVSLVWGMGRR